ncbi:hypothetical protein [Myroides odoratus]|uniref:hypothetical protein n=1 Tax=Myroides odoratus TaxID=256 RepID=UPI000765A3DA|nr:hypothetical protein [Myroides odoratus]
MRNIVPGVLVFFLLLCTACNTDDTVIPSYTQITKEQKALVVGDWQLTYYTNTAGDKLDLSAAGILVRYAFTKEGIVTIENGSSQPIRFTDNSQYLTSDGTTEYVFDYVKQWGDEIEKKERLYFRGPWQPTIAFDLDEVTQDQLILSQEGKETYVFKRLPKDVVYPKISEEDKRLLVGTWRLYEISDFTGKKRVFNETEVVEYDFGYNEWLIVNNKSALEGGIFNQFIKMRLSSYSYRFDFKWEQQEVLYIDDLGSYTMRIAQDRLILAVSDGVVLKLDRLK